MFTGEHISPGSGVFTPELLGYLDIKKPALWRERHNVVLLFSNQSQPSLIFHFCLKSAALR